MSTKKNTSTKEDFKKVAQKAKSETKEAINESAKKADEAKQAIQKTVKKVEDESKKTASKVKTQAKDTVKKVEKETKSVAKKAKKTATKAIENAMVKEMYFEFADKQINASDLSDKAISDYKAQGNKEIVKSVKLYVKAEDCALYYVINDEFSSKISL